MGDSRVVCAKREVNRYLPMFTTTGANRGVIAAVLAVTCLVAVVVVNQDSTADATVREGSDDLLRKAENAGWLSDGEGKIIDHEDDIIVRRKAAANDAKYGVLSKEAMYHDVKETQKENEDVAGLMAKAVKGEHKEDKKLKKSEAKTEDDIREITDENYHKKKQSERNAKKRARAKAKLMAKIANMRKKARTEVLFKKDCKNLRAMFVRGDKKNSKAFARVRCDGGKVKNAKKAKGKAKKKASKKK